MAVKIRDGATGFLHEQHSSSGVPRLEAKFPEAIETTGSDAGEIERGGAVAAHAVRAQREIVIVMNIGICETFVNRESSAEQAGGQSFDLGDRDFLSI